jgi:hypothetical protein
VHAAEDFGVFRSGSLRSALLQNPKDSGRALARRLRFDVAAAIRRFSLPHRFRVLQFDCAFAHDLVQRAGIAFRLYGSLRAVNLLLVPALQIDRARFAISRLLRFHAGKSSGQIDERRNRMEQIDEMVPPDDLILASIRYRVGDSTHF